MNGSGLTPEILLDAYASGVFPMAESRDDPEIFWVDPRQRGVIPLDKFHISRSLRRKLRSGQYHATRNADFKAVLDGCANRTETWINAQIRSLYLDLHKLNHAHSIEVWDGNLLAGGIYGVALGGAFFGESMFSAQRDGSKMALATLVDLLSRGGFTLLDVQFISPHLSSLGAKEITRTSYRKRLAKALPVCANFPAEQCINLAQVSQRRTQTS